MSKKANKVVKLKERRQQKIDSVRKNRRKRLFIISAILITVLAVALLLYYSNFFQVNEIEVKGNKNISDAVVIENSGIKRTDNLLGLPSKKIVSKLKKISWVESVDVIRDWPDTVLLLVKERKPTAFIETDEDRFLIDGKGFVIGKLNSLKVASTVVKIDGLPLKNVAAGKNINSKALTNALKAYKGLYKKLQKQVYSITAESNDELYFIAGGVQIIYGKAEKMELKNKVIQTILKEKKEEIATLDIRIPDKPVVRVLGK